MKISIAVHIKSYSCHIVSHTINSTRAPVGCYSLLLYCIYGIHDISNSNSSIQCSVWLLHLHTSRHPNTFLTLYTCVSAAVSHRNCHCRCYCHCQLPSLSSSQYFVKLSSSHAIQLPTRTEQLPCSSRTDFPLLVGRPVNHCPPSPFLLTANTFSGYHLNFSPCRPLTSPASPSPVEAPSLISPLPNYTVFVPLFQLQRQLLSYRSNFHLISK